MALSRAILVFLASVLVSAGCQHVSAGAAPDAGSDADTDTDSDSDSDSDSDGDTGSDTGWQLAGDAGFDTDTTGWSAAEDAGVLLSVWGSGPDDVYAGGEGRTLLHGSDTTWELLPLPASFDDQDFIAADIHGSAWDSVYIAQGLNDLCDSRIVRFDGEHWGCGGAPVVGCGTQAIWVSGAGDLFGVTADYLPMDPPTDVVFAFRYDGSVWTAENVATFDYGPSFEDMAGTPEDHLFVLAEECAHGAFVYDGTDWWFELEKDSGWSLHGVWALDDANVWAVGDGGTVLRRGTGVWEYEDAPTSARLDGIFGWSATEQIAVGDGVILRRSGDAWELEAPPIAGVHLHGVWGAAPDDVYAVGEHDGGALIIHSDGATWSVVYGG
jgi:hypothetical protein